MLERWEPLGGIILEDNFTSESILNSVWQIGLLLLEGMGGKSIVDRGKAQVESDKMKMKLLWMNECVSSLKGRPVYALK